MTWIFKSSNSRGSSAWTSKSKSRMSAEMKGTFGFQTKQTCSRGPWALARARIQQIFLSRGLPFRPTTAFPASWAVLSGLFGYSKFLKLQQVFKHKTGPQWTFAEWMKAGKKDYKRARAASQTITAFQHTTNNQFHCYRASVLWCTFSLAAFRMRKYKRQERAYQEGHLSFLVLPYSLGG